MVTARSIPTDITFQSSPSPKTRCNFNCPQLYYKLSKKSSISLSLGDLRWMHVLQYEYVLVGDFILPAPLHIGQSEKAIYSTLSLRQDGQLGG